MSGELDGIKDFDLLGARILDPHAAINMTANLYIRNGIIHHSPPKNNKTSRVFEINNHVVLPGLLDLRVHNRVPGSGQSESIESLTRAAARGGFSSILACGSIGGMHRTYIGRVSTLQH